MRVFISYVGPDRAIAEAIRSRLSARGVDVWIDISRLAPGESVSQAISEAIDSADAYVFLISRAWLGSEWTLLELGGALSQSVEHGKRLVPVIAESGIRLPAVLRDYSYVDLSGEKPESGALDAVVEATCAPVELAAADSTDRLSDSMQLLEQGRRTLALERDYHLATLSWQTSLLTAWLRLVVVLLALGAGMALTVHDDLRWPVTAILTAVLPMLGYGLATLRHRDRDPLSSRFDRRGEH